MYVKLNRLIHVVESHQSVVQFVEITMYLRMKIVMMEILLMETGVLQIVWLKMDLIVYGVRLVVFAQLFVEIL